jgi:hypothetical protein
MGEGKQKKSATKKFLARYPDCCFCGGIRTAATREHMPPKALFDSSYRPDKLVMPACDECNRQTSTADLVASVISRWSFNMSALNNDHPRLAAQMRKQAPDIIKEWTRPIDRAKARQHLEDYGVRVPHDAALVTVGPLTVAQLNAFAHKVVLGLYFEHFRNFVPNAGRVFAMWRTKEDFARGGIPPLLFQMMRRYGTLEQGTWNTAEIFEYRYEFNAADGLFACLARLRGGLYVTGFAVSDFAVIAKDTSYGWIKPEDLLKMMHDPAFQKRS